MLRLEDKSCAPRVDCARCGEPLTRARRGVTVCRLCATKSAYAYLERAATERRRRGKVPADSAA